MTLPEFKAIVKEIKPITKKNGQIINYLFVERPELCNDLDGKVEPRNVFPVLVYPGKSHLLHDIEVGDNVNISVYMNSKEYITRMGWKNWHISLHLKTIKK